MSLTYHRILLQIEGSFFCFLPEDLFHYLLKTGGCLGINEILSRIFVYFGFFIYTECKSEIYGKLSNVKIERWDYMYSIAEYWECASILIDFSKNRIKIQHSMLEYVYLYILVSKWISRNCCDRNVHAMAERLKQMHPLYMVAYASTSWWLKEEFTRLLVEQNNDCFSYSWRVTELNVKKFVWKQKYPPQIHKYMYVLCICTRLDYWGNICLCLQYIKLA